MTVICRLSRFPLWNTFACYCASNTDHSPSKSRRLITPSISEVKLEKEYIEKALIEKANY